MNAIFDKLLDAYGYQGWWPIMGYVGVNPTKTGYVSGYHPGDYSFPKNELEQFEIIMGAVLTQNTNWIQAEKSLINLRQLTDFTAENILSLNEKNFKQAIKPSGYFN